MKIRQYNRTAVALHWLMAALVLLLLFLGTVFLAPHENSDPRKVEGLIAHASLGAFVGVLTLIRLANLWLRGHPDDISEPGTVLARAATAGHVALYVLLLGIVGSGIAMAVMFDFLGVNAGTANLPANFDGVTARAVHGALTTGLMAMIGLHVLAALYHQFILRDGLFSRMSFRRMK